MGVPVTLVFHPAPPRIQTSEEEGSWGLSGKKGWCEGGGLRTYRESHCRGRGGSGCCFQHRCWALGPAPHSAGCGSGLHLQCMHSTQTTATSLLWVVGWDEVNCPGTLWWGLESSMVLPSPGQMYSVPGQACVAHSASSVCSPRQMSSPGEGAGLVQERVR